jgi:DnaJ-class molecular chaperone
MTDLDPYVLLGISPEAGLDEIRAAFRRAVRREHPDTASHTPDSSAVGNVVDAYRLLIDPVKRARYDAAQAMGGPLYIGIRIPVRGASTARSTMPHRRSWCPDCSGTGCVASLVTCPRCKGTAETTELGYRSARIVRCQTCRGRGEVTISAPCDSCGGPGTTSISSDT